MMSITLFYYLIIHIISLSFLSDEAEKHSKFPKDFIKSYREAVKIVDERKAAEEAFNDSERESTDDAETG